MKIEYMLNHHHHTLECIEMGDEQPETIIDCLIKYQANDDITDDSLIDHTNVDGAQWKNLRNNCSTGIEIQPG